MKILILYLILFLLILVFIAVVTRIVSVIVFRTYYEEKRKFWSSNTIGTQNNDWSSQDNGRYT